MNTKATTTATAVSLFVVSLSYTSSISTGTYRVPVPGNCSMQFGRQAKNARSTAPFCQDPKILKKNREGTTMSLLGKKKE
jgi:hypothetical protein